MEVDLKFPIDIMWWQERWQILDGMHRLCKAVVMEQMSVNVRKVPVEWIDRIIPDGE